MVPLPLPSISSVSVVASLSCLPFRSVAAGMSTVTLFSPEVYSVELSEPLKKSLTLTVSV